MNTIFHVQFPGLGLEFTIDRCRPFACGFNIYWYGVVIALGLLLGMVWAFRCAPDYGIDGDRLVDVVMIGTVFGIVCARICYIAMAPFEYQSIWEMFDLRLAGWPFMAASSARLYSAGSRPNGAKFRCCRCSMLSVWGF